MRTFLMGLVVGVGLAGGLVSAESWILSDERGNQGVVMPAGPGMYSYFGNDGSTRTIYDLTPKMPPYRSTTDPCGR